MPEPRRSRDRGAAVVLRESWCIEHTVRMALTNSKERTDERRPYDERDSLGAHPGKVAKAIRRYGLQGSRQQGVQ